MFYSRFMAYAVGAGFAAEGIPGGFSREFDTGFRTPVADRGYLV